eukprot:4838766-Pyramimonas_sp.AAC.1
MTMHVGGKRHLENVEGRKDVMEQFAKSAICWGLEDIVQAGGLLEQVRDPTRRRLPTPRSSQRSRLCFRVCARRSVSVVPAAYKYATSGSHTAAKLGRPRHGHCRIDR